MTGRLSDASYKAVYEQVPRFCVSAAVLGPAGIALVKRVENPAIGLWHLPGGRVSKGETCEQALRRVVQRELGIFFTSPPLLIGFIENLSEDYVNAAGTFTVHNVDLVFSIRVLENSLVPSRDEGPARWFIETPPALEWGAHIPWLIKRGLLKEAHGE